MARDTRRIRSARRPFRQRWREGRAAPYNTRPFGRKSRRPSADPPRPLALAPRLSRTFKMRGFLRPGGGGRESVHLRAAAEEPMEVGADDECDRTSARGVQ